MTWLGSQPFTRPRALPEPRSGKAAVFLPPELFDLPGNLASRSDTLTLWRAYRAYALCYACMSYRATKLAEAPLWIKDETDDGDVWLTGDHVLGEVLRHPNPDMDMADLLELTSLYQDTAGICVWHKTRDNAGRVVRLYPYHRDEAQIDAADGRLFGRFTLQTATGPLTVGAEDVVFFRNPNPGNLQSGLGPLEVALSHVNIGVNLRTAVAAALVNAVRPGSKVETKAPFATDDDFDRFMAHLQQQAGAIQTGKPLVMENAVFTLLGSPLSDLDMGPVQGDVEAAICQAFAVHPALVMAKLGVESNAGFADTLEPATDLFYDTVVMPRWAKIERALTRQLLVEADDTPDRMIAFDTTKVRALEDDLSEQMKQARLGAGFWTVDEARTHTGQQPLGGEAGDALLTVSAASPATGTTTPEGEAEKQAKAFDRRDAERLIAGATRGSEESLMDLAARAALDTNERAVYAAIGYGGQKADADHEKPLTQADAIRLAHAVDTAITEGETTWKDRLTPPITQSATGSVERLSNTLGVTFDLLQPGLLAYVERQAAELVTQVNDTTKQAIQRAIADSLQQGEGIRGLARRIQETGAFSPARARLIAITETTKARNGASLGAMQHYAAEHPQLAVAKEWLNSGDAKVRTAHQDAPVGVGREVVDVNATFSNGLDHPSEPNCRCTLLYDVNVRETHDGT